MLPRAFYVEPVCKGLTVERLLAALALVAGVPLYLPQIFSREDCTESTKVCWQGICRWLALS